MATNKWLGTATAVAQVDTYTPINVLVGNVFTLTMTGFDGSVQSVNYTAAVATVADVTAGLTSAWNTNADNNALIGSLTAADGTTVLTLTADTAGVEFKALGSATGGTADITEVNTTANAGPNDYSSTANWSEGALPGAADDVFIEDSNVDILYGLDQSAAGTYTSFHAKRTFTGVIGWNGAAGVVGDYLQIRTSKAFIGEHFLPNTASGSGRIKINFGTVASEITQYFMATSLDSPKQAFRMLAVEVGTVLKDVISGSAGIATETGEVSTVANALISKLTSASSDASLVIGSGVTMVDLTCLGGETSLFTTASQFSGTVTSKGGSLVISGSGAVPTLNVDGGAVVPASTGLISTCNIENGSADFTKSVEARTVTTMNLGVNGVLSADIVKGGSGVLTITNGITPIESGRLQFRASQI